MESGGLITVQRRFGYGVVPDVAAKIARDPMAHAVGQLEAYRYQDRSKLGSSQTLLKRHAKLRGDAAAAGTDSKSATDAFQAGERLVRTQYLRELDYRYERAVSGAAPLVERLVSFWSDHFAVSCLKAPRVRLIAGAYEREVIRPHVTGRFRDMLGAVMHHPAMLAYLDNVLSIGPDSKKGRWSGKGLNENLGRELLELHTVGVDAGYSQQDVTEASRVITGWTVDFKTGKRTGRFYFDAEKHQPGAFEVMGRVFDQKGEAQGEALLDMLASHPATAKHIARKLVRHFVGDAGSQGLIDVVAKRFRETDGDLKETMVALIRQPESWNAPPAKVIPPFDMLVAFEKLTGVRLDARQLNNLARNMGQQIWSPRSPAGLPKGDEDWATSGAMVGRLKLAMRVARKSGFEGDPMALADAALGNSVTDPLRDAISRAATRKEAIAMLLLSPQIQVR